MERVTSAEGKTALLSRPITKLPRLQLVLRNLEAFSPEDHPDREDIPTILQVLDRIILSSQVRFANVTHSSVVAWHRIR